MNAKVFSAAVALSFGLVVAIEAADAPRAEARNNNAANAQQNNNRELQFNGADLDLANAGRRNRDRSAAAELVGVNVGSFAPFASNGYDNVGYGWGYHHSSTAGGDYFRGGAQFISATGQAIKNLSEAMVNGEVARDLAIDNNFKFAETYWAGRRMWKEERNYERGQPLSTDQLVQIARDAAPDRLSPRELNPTTNDINWPSALRRPEFETLRALVQDKFDGRTVSNTGFGSETEAAITQLSKAMEAKLRAQIRTMPSNQYIAAQKFLSSLPYETRFMPAVEGLASR